ncbi:hypothetical protein DFP73DRAFT_620546 [Morchella snyderi]|nr:hypothetical protein DFP73DRAFT_620546 [Morchella snyderi]
MTPTPRSKYGLRERRPNATSTHTTKLSSPKDTAPYKTISKRIASKAITMVISPSSTEKGEEGRKGGEITPKRKRTRGKKNPPPSPVFNPAINELRPPESGSENDGKDDDDHGNDLRRTKKCKISAAQSVAVAKRVTTGRKIPKGQGVDYDITIGRKYQAEPCVHTPHISEERLQEIFEKIRKNIKKGVTEQNIIVRPWNYILPTKAQISRRKQQDILLYTEIGCAKVAATKTKTTPALRAPALIALERERQIAKLRSTRASVAPNVFRTTGTRDRSTSSTSKNKERGQEEEEEEEDDEDQGGEDEAEEKGEDEDEDINDDDEEEDDEEHENEAEAKDFLTPSLSVYSPYWSTHKKETEEGDDDYVPPSALNRISLNTRHEIKENRNKFSTLPYINPLKSQLKNLGSPSSGAQAKSSEDRPSALGESSSQAQGTPINAASREERSIVDYPRATKTSEISSSTNTELYGVKDSRGIISPVKAIASQPRASLRDASPSPSSASSSIEIIGPPQRPSTPRSSSTQIDPTSVRAVDFPEHQSASRSPLLVRSSIRFSGHQRNSPNGRTQATSPREFLDSSSAISPSSTGSFWH